MHKQFIKDLKVGDAVQSEFLVTEKSLVAFSQPSRSGEQFLRMQLADISGSMRAVAWEKGPDLASRFRVGDVIRVVGEVCEYRGQQLVVFSLKAVPVDQVDKNHFKRTSERNRQEMLNDLAQATGAVTDAYLSRLLAEFFSDGEFLAQYADAPAARTVHHNYVGGLLEHSLEVVALCRHFINSYPELDPSLLYAGALLHDVGKVREYDFNGLSIEMTTRGKLIGHIAIGKEMIDERAARVEGFPAGLLMELSHMVLSHHGQKEWGSPEVPKTFAAFALFHADLVSARLNQFAQVAGKGGSQDGWTEWDRLLDRSIFLGDAESCQQKHSEHKRVAIT